MKRKELIKHLFDEGCILDREGAKHSVFFNPLSEKYSTIPHHNEIDNWLAKKICKDLSIKIISGK